MANTGLTSAITAIATAQLLKLPAHYTHTGEWDIRRLIGSGGMPSSHSSGVSALAAYIATKYGWKTPEFGVAALLSIVVMYDAMNIRRSAGEIAMQVNDLDENVERLSGDRPGIYHKRKRERLKERLGHTPREVAVGALIGTCIGFTGALIAKKKR